MKRWIRRIQIAALLTCFAPCAQAMMLSCPPGCQPPRDNEVRVLMPIFSSQNPGLGSTVSTVLGFQIWQTLRQGPEGNIGTTRGSVAIDQSSFWKLAPASITASDLLKKAADARSGNGAQMVFWGDAQPFAGGTVVQSWLVIGADIRPRQPESWIVTDGQNHSLKADMPSLFYEFRPFVLKSDVIARYSNPRGMILFSDPQGLHAIGSVGEEMQALEQSPTAARVVAPTRTAAPVGWIMLPELAESRTEAVDFVSGLIRIYRADWDGAIQMMRRALENPNAPTKVRLDANLYIAMAAAQKPVMDTDTMQTALNAAETLVPENRAVTMYKVMADIAQASKASAGQRTRFLDEADGLLTQRAWVFSDSDSWLHNAQEMIRGMREAAPPVAR